MSDAQATSSTVDIDDSKPVLETVKKFGDVIGSMWWIDDPLTYDERTDAVNELWDEHFECPTPGSAAAQLKQYYVDLNMVGGTMRSVIREACVVVDRRRKAARVAGEELNIPVQS